MPERRVDGAISGPGGVEASFDWRAAHDEANGTMLRVRLRMERLLDEMDGLKEDLKELKVEIKNDDFNVRAVSKLVTSARHRHAARPRHA
jgi:uncharacterized protein (UPF0335 family)